MSSNPEDALSWEAVLDDPQWDAALEELAWQLRLDEGAAFDPDDETVTDGVAADDTSDTDTSDTDTTNTDTTNTDTTDKGPWFPLTRSTVLAGTVPERIDRLIDIQREVSRLAALEADLFVSLLGESPVQREVVVLDRDTDTERSLFLTDEMREELALALHRPCGQVHDQVEVARLLAGPLQATHRALSAGDISPVHARVIAEQAQRLQRHMDADSFADACARLEQRVLGDAPDLTASQTRSLARRAVESIDRDAARRRREAARCQVGVALLPDDDGLALVQACLPTADAMRVHAAVEALARGPLAESMPGSTLGERQATALLDLVLGQPAVQVKAEVGVVIDLATLLGLSDDTGLAQVGADEPMALAELRDLLSDARTPAQLRRLVTDPTTGALIDRGRATYEVTDALRAFLVARDATCRFPGCQRRARRCQMDHVIPWHDGGRTDRDNLGPLCVRHHQLKTHSGWDITKSAADGSCEWTSPLGRTQVVPPRRLLPEPDPPLTQLPAPDPPLTQLPAPDPPPTVLQEPDPPPF